MTRDSKSARSAYNHEWYLKSREHLLDLFGPFCSMCGESDPTVLQFDHVAPERRRGWRARGRAIVDVLCAMRSKDMRPFGFQVLCANCHVRKTKSEF